MYEVETEHYQGPLDKLLELVESKELDISLISLAQVTGDFFNHLKNLQDNEAPHRLIADFLEVASKLILIKSQEAVPDFELEEEEKESAEKLELQLEIYQKIKKGEENIEKQWSRFPKMETRKFLQNKEVLFYPPPRLKLEDFHEEMQEIAEEIKKLKPVEEIEHKVVDLQNKIEQVLSHLQKENIKINKDSNTSKREIVSLFMAILHLFKDELVHIQQEDQFGEIHVESKAKG